MYSRCTGARQVATGLNELARRNGKVSTSTITSLILSSMNGLQVLVTSMCIGTGMGAAAVFVRD